MDRHSLLQGILPTQGSNLGLPHCRWVLYHLSHQGRGDYCRWKVRGLLRTVKLEWSRTWGNSSRVYVLQGGLGEVQLEFRADTAAQSILAASLQGRAGMDQAGQTKACKQEGGGQNPTLAVPLGCRSLCISRQRKSSEQPAQGPAEEEFRTTCPGVTEGKYKGKAGAPETRAREVRVCNVLASLGHGSCPQSAPSWSCRCHSIIDSEAHTFQSAGPAQGLIDFRKNYRILREVVK